MIAALFPPTIYAQAVTSGDPRSVVDIMTSDMRLVVAFVSLLAGLLTLIGGVGLRKRKSWAWLCVGPGMHEFTERSDWHGPRRLCLWVLTRSEARQSLGVDANGSFVMRATKVTAALSLLLIIASYPCLSV